MRTLLGTLALLTVCVSTTWAGEVEFPKNEPIFTITLPEGWEVDSDDDDVIEAQSPKENLSVTIWEIETEMTVAELAKDLKNILKDYATDVKLEEEPKQLEIDGLPGIFMFGTGDDKEDGHQVGFIALVIVKGDDASIIFFEMDSNISKDELKKFDKIIESIKAK